MYCKACRKKLKGDQTCPCGSPDRLFYADYYPEGRQGPRVQRLIDVDNIEAARTIEGLIRAGSLEARKPGAVKQSFTTATIEELTRDYLEWVKLHYTAQTYRERTYTMNYINRIVGNVPVQGFNDHHVSLYQKTRKAQGVSGRTINKELNYVRGFLRWAREEKGMETRTVKMKALPEPRPIPIVLSPSEVKRILDAATPYYRAFILCLYTLVLRFKEAAHLRWSDIDFENKAVRCQQKGGTFKILPLSKMLISALKEIGQKDGDQYVFGRGEEGRPPVNVRKTIKALCQKTGITKRVYPHLFRHSGATALMADGVNLRVVQRMLGHADIGTTEWYTTVVMEHLRGAGDSLENGLSRRGNSQNKQQIRRVK